MIDIIKKGKINRNRFRATCDRCGCKLLCDSEDLACSARLGKGTPVYYINCPTRGCDKLLIAHETEVESEG